MKFGLEYFNNSVAFIAETLKRDGPDSGATAFAQSIFEDLSPAQIAFVQKAIDEGFGEKLDFTYSGRGMYGKLCPAVILGQDERNDFGFKGASADSMGLGSVIYMR